MRTQALKWTARGIAIAVPVIAFGSLTTARAWDTPPTHFAGLLNDYTAAAPPPPVSPPPAYPPVMKGPYEMRGRWTLDVDPRRGVARFSAEMNMETSDYGITEGIVKPFDPTTRGAHTHHIVVTDGTLGGENDWMADCPMFNPPVTKGFVITGSAFVTGNGGPPPFGNPSQVTICILGGANVGYSNMTLSFANGSLAATHFGTQPIHGVVVNCGSLFQPESSDCTVQQ
jgi:hypothetical protein